ncbi:unnamed protein product [Parnassius apollo]|uniref:(apollo) hypothetical protein n=1 Tax=Parnassius apollo TaxID=110799 RepID=A0A8S3WTQ8_PARAO|nr:unnamed protein product [Parnassius apollo]
MSSASRAIIFVILMNFLPEISVYKLKSDMYEYYGPYIGNKETPEIFPYVTDEQYVRRIHSMVNAYNNRGDLNGGLVIETNALIDTKYRTWKRNADLINSLLALPKDMNDAGR